MTLVDHRDERTPEQQGRSVAEALVRSWLDVIPDGRASIQFLEANRFAAMSRLHLYGKRANTVVGLAIALRAGQIARLVLFAPEHESGMRTCFDHASTGAPEDGMDLTMPRVVMATRWQRQYDRLCGAANDRDWVPATACLAPDLVAIDHRSPATFGEIHGRDAFTDYARGLLALADNAALTTVQTEGDHHFGIAHSWWAGHQNHGGAEFLLERTVFSTAGEHGIERIEYFDAHDMADTARRLLEHHPDDEVRAVWTPQVSDLLAVNTRDWTQLGESFSADVC